MLQNIIHNRLIIGDRTLKMLTARCLGSTLLVGDASPGRGRRKEGWLTCCQGTQLPGPRGGSLPLQHGYRKLPQEPRREASGLLARPGPIFLMPGFILSPKLVNVLFLRDHHFKFSLHFLQNLPIGSIFRARIPDKHKDCGHLITFSVWLRLSHPPTSNPFSALIERTCRA